jgi:hypothetical protein
MRRSVSRRFITATAERLAEFRSRPLDDQRWLINPGATHCTRRCDDFSTPDTSEVA